LNNYQVFIIYVSSAEEHELSDDEADELFAEGATGVAALQAHWTDIVAQLKPGGTDYRKIIQKSLQRTLPMPQTRQSSRLSPTSHRAMISVRNSWFGSAR
jgi:hypothetical protein